MQKPPKIAFMHIVPMQSRNAWHAGMRDRNAHYARTPTARARAPRSFCAFCESHCEFTKFHALAHTPRAAAAVVATSTAAAQHAKQQLTSRAISHMRYVKRNGWKLR